MRGCLLVNLEKTAHEEMIVSELKKFSRPQREKCGNNAPLFGVLRITRIPSIIKRLINKFLSKTSFH